MSNIITNSGKLQTARPDAVDKAIALIFLKEALIAEAYESCSALIETAKRCGARTREISKLLAGAAPKVKGRF